MTNYHAWDSKADELCREADEQVELYKCSRLELSLDQPLGTLQVDECEEPVAVKYAERDHVGLVDADLRTEPVRTLAGRVQLLTNLSPRFRASDFSQAAALYSLALQLVALKASCAAIADVSDAEPKAKYVLERFHRANHIAKIDYIYTFFFRLGTPGAREMEAKAPDMGTVWANRAQCWLKMGDHEKAFADAEKCTVEPMNPKGWFRKGISEALGLHAMQRYAEAIPALLEDAGSGVIALFRRLAFGSPLGSAEKLEPSNKQILDAIKMALTQVQRHVLCVPGQGLGGLGDVMVWET
ncbi:hypothetical protein AK812_SmicGene41248 [Symbiodinium microadriaticum]|uniref:Uncharacterized protein n=1 Tax=Symbiodinium microadriaticum TaxID=2951 RepID=A0A1Q9C6M6_SYMMI|nr:hypothetical protein AK812_SmicGene41248 [Symbiodinium microadriaticum]